MQCYGRLLAEPNINIKTWNTVKKNKETEEVLSTEHMPSLHINNKKIKDPGDVADAFQ
jgi:hypothetical protein